MIITLDVTHYHDWIAAPPEALPPTDKDIKARRVKQDVGGKWLMRVSLSAKEMTDKDTTYLTISIPEPQIQKLYAHYERLDKYKTRDRLVVFYVEESVLPHHAKTQHVVGVTVHDDGPDASSYEAFLKAERVTAADGSVKDLYDAGDVTAMVMHYVNDKSDVQGALNRAFNVSPANSQSNDREDQ